MRKDIGEQPDKGIVPRIYKESSKINSKSTNNKKTGKQ